jgi:hypothetical protein
VVGAADGGTLGGALASPENGVDHPVCRRHGRRARGDVKVALIDDDAAGALTFHQHDADCVGRHRHAKHDVHRSSKLCERG